MNENFLLQIDFSSRIILQKPLMVGDSLLAGVLTLRYRGNYERAIAELPIAYVEGVPQMSSMLPYSMASREVVTVTHIRSIMRDMNHDPDMARILDKMPSNSDLSPSEGPLGNISNSYPTYDIPRVYFIGCGDIEAIDRIIGDTAFVGAQKNRGHGQVSGHRIRPINTPEALANKWFGMIGVRNGRNRVLRPIPSRLRDLLPADLVCSVSNATWHNPYFAGYPNSVVEECLVPLFATGESFYEQEIEDDLSRIAA